jgi:phosphatidylglycerophosphate synthase
MTRVQLAPIGFAVAGAAVVSLLSALPVLGDGRPLPATGWLAALGYLLVSNALLLRALRRRGTTRFGAANVVTAIRSTLVGMITGVVAASFSTSVSVSALLCLVVPALILDAVDGSVARHTGTASELGARFDMEVDAFLLLVLSAYVAQSLGIWVLAIGLMRYVFVAVGWELPWFRRQLPPRYWRKVVTAVQGIALALAVSGLLPGLDAIFVGIALALLIESFGRDVVWLVVRRKEPASVRLGQPSRILRENG